MNIFSTLSAAISAAVSDTLTGFMSDGRKAIYTNGAGEYVLVGDRAFASGPVVATVFKGRVSIQGNQP